MLDSSYNRDIMIMLNEGNILFYVNKVMGKILQYKDINLPINNIRKEILTKIIKDVIMDINLIHVHSVLDSSILLDGLIIDKNIAEYNYLYKDIEFRYKTILFNNINSDIFIDVIIVKANIMLYIQKVYNYERD